MSLARRAMLVMCLAGTVHAAGPGGPGLPPIVLRIAAVSVGTAAIPSSADSTARTAKGVFWLLSTSVLTFGVPLLDLPRVLAQGSADARSARQCEDSWKAVLEGAPPWLGSTDGQAYLLRTIRDELVRLTVDGHRPVTVEINPVDAAGPASSRVLAEVSVAVDPQPTGCSARFGAAAKLSVEATGAQTVSAWAPVDVHEWAQDPEAARPALLSALRQLAAQIVQAYPWPADQRE